jgi:hypothetical protein
MSDVHACDFEAELERARLEIDRLNALINNPHTNDFLEAVRTEAAHQRERWAAEHDAGKADSDWFWLVGHLAGKALSAADFVRVCGGLDELLVRGDYVEKQRDKALHHIITTAAACLNWHAARTGVDTRMRPGIAAPP